MAIGNAIERGPWVYIYSDRGQATKTVQAGTGADDGLVGYTSSRVNIRRGAWIYSYDERGRQIGTVPAQ